MEENKNLKCGTVAIVGRPNVGKSTLLNKIVGEKVSIVSRVPQTTRFQIRGIYTDDRGQIIFTDTPGWHLGRDKLDKYMNQASTGAMFDVDCVIYLADVTRRVGEEERGIVERVKECRAPVILGLNKVDIKDIDLQPYITLWEEAKGKPINEIDNFTMIALSGLEGINVDKLLEILFGYLPHGPMLYPADTISDTPRRMLIADIIREKFLMVLKQELPHSIGVHIEHIQPVRKKTLQIKA
ncbi:MAG: GTPase Era, partial [Candidatus Omnitrophica bacterium]|nr:GTPase Era [Candidatus Omnitrophota bacterium]